MPKRVVGFHEIDAITALSAHVTTLSKQLESLNVSAIQTPSQACELCGGNHASVDCKLVSPFLHLQKANFVLNFQRQQHNPCSNTYKLA